MAIGVFIRDFRSAYSSKPAKKCSLLCIFDRKELNTTLNFGFYILLKENL